MRGMCYTVYSGSTVHESCTARPVSHMTRARYIYPVILFSSPIGKDFIFTT
jgi:hypothetical protein